MSQTERTELRIEVGTPREVSRAAGNHWFPTMLYRLHDDSLLLGYSVCDDAMTCNVAAGMAHALLKSPDNGLNWFLLNVWQGKFYNEALPIGVLPDGRILGTAHSTALQNEQGAPYLLDYVSRDHARSWDGPRVTPIHFPDGLLKPDVNLHPGRTLAPVSFEGNALALADNRLVRIADPMFKDDRFSRVCLMESLDEGKSWTYVATIADQYDAPRHFNESALVEVEAGHLLCVMRTDLDGPNPMYQAHSTDGGRTWSAPKLCGFNGVRPALVRMQNGVIACSYGRLSGFPSQGVQVMFSLDDGENWIQPTPIYHAASTGYTCMIERRPGELLLCYDVLGSGWARDNAIMAVRVAVTR